MKISYEALNKSDMLDEETSRIKMRTNENSQMKRLETVASTVLNEN